LLDSRFPEWKTRREYRVEPMTAASSAEKVPLRIREPPQLEATVRTLERLR
jgi:hypothetical protein